MKIILVLVTLIMFIFPVKASNNFEFELTRVIDVDTIIGSINMPLGITLRNQRIRLLGINAVELPSKLAKQQKEWLEERLRNKELTITILDEKYCFSRDGYSRVLAFIHDKEANINIEISKLKNVEDMYPRNKRCTKIIKEIMKGN